LKERHGGELAELRQHLAEKSVFGDPPDRGNDAKPICAQLQGAWLEGAQLQGALLNGARLRGAWLPFAQLQLASLEGAQLQGAFLNGAQLQGGRQVERRHSVTRCPSA
jgi:hypothetical protein